jgi:SPP1 family predicted phage head-tail adaptor
MLKAGVLRHHRITIQVPVMTKDSNGSDIETWQNLYVDVPAQNIPLSVNQFMAAKASQSKIRGRFVIRNRPGLSARNRVIENGLAYDIEGWLPDPESGKEYVTAPYGQGVNPGGF